MRLGLLLTLCVTAAACEAAEPASPQRADASEPADASGADSAAPDASSADSAMPDPGAAQYQAMAALVARSCAFESCHGGARGKAQLNFKAQLEAGRPLTELLNDVPSCQYPPMPRVTPHAPERSWLMVKLTGAHDDTGKLTFVPDEPFQPQLEGSESQCPLVEGGELSFGQLMPINGTESQRLPESELAVFRAWIEAGAPGPL